MIGAIQLPPFDPLAMVLIALFNPVVIAVAVVMGRQADQWQKTIVAGFAAALAGAAAVWLATSLQILPGRGMGSDAGIFVLSFLYGTGIAVAAYHLRRRMPRD